MNEFIAKKLGEVLAFSRVGQSLLERGAAGFEQIWEADQLSDIAAKLAEQQQALEQDASDTTLAKADATGAKLTGMAETYIGDQWDNPAELLEWLGFFAGAAVVHWRLVEGAAEQVEDTELTKLVHLGVELHAGWLTEVGEKIKQLGAARAA